MVTQLGKGRLITMDLNNLCALSDRNLASSRHPERLRLQEYQVSITERLDSQWKFITVAGCLGIVCAEKHVEERNSARPVEKETESWAQKDKECWGNWINRQQRVVPVCHFLSVAFVKRTGVLLWLDSNKTSVKAVQVYDFAPTTNEDVWRLLCWTSQLSLSNPH